MFIYKYFTDLKCPYLHSATSYSKQHSPIGVARVFQSVQIVPIRAKRLSDCHITFYKTAIFAEINAEFVQ